MSVHQDLSQSKDEAELSKLMREAQAGDSNSYHQLLMRIRDMLGRFVGHSFARLGLDRGSSAADDVVQDILLAVHLKRSTYDPEQFVLPWLYAIARYKIIDHFRRHRRQHGHARNVSVDDELETLEVALTAPEISTTAGHDVEHLLQNLSEKQQVILRMIKLDGLSVAEVAKQTGYTASDIKVTVHRAIKALRTVIEDGENG